MFRAEEVRFQSAFYIRYRSNNSDPHLKSQGNSIMIIPLNIVTSYPVNWTRYQVLRDFVQNFYDSVGFRDFNKRFQYQYHAEDHALHISVEHVVFNYEWLLHIGASTKQVDQNNAGYFGEGFKMAALCAQRDYSWQIYMRSGDWEFNVTTTDHQIDDTTLKMLAYDVRTAEKRDESCLIIKGLSDTDYHLFENVILSFYYPENPLFGELLWEDYSGAIYTRSDVPIPTELPCTYKFGRKGCVFCAY